MIEKEHITNDPTGVKGLTKECRDGPDLMVV